MSSFSDIRLDGVTKVFRTGLWRKKIAVKDVTFEVPPGEVVGLLGPNGSGKSTTIKMMLGFLRPTRGQISLLGHAPIETKARRFIGYLPENPRFQKFLTARQLLHYHGCLLNLLRTELPGRIDELLEWVNLREAASDRIQSYSKGMGQRLAIAQALLGRPRLLIFDEPMSGLDPLGRREIRQTIRRIQEEMKETTLFFSTHVLSDVEELCSSVLLLKKGVLTAQSPISELLGQDRQRFEVTLGDLPVEEAKGLPNTEWKKVPLGISLFVDGVESLGDTLAHLKQRRIKVIGISSQRKTLEDALFNEREAN